MFPWLSLAICTYHPLFQAGLLDYILCPNRAVVGKFLLVSHHSHVHVKGSIGKHHLWVHHCFSSNVPSFVHLIWIVLEIGGWWPYNCCFAGCCFQDLFNIACSILVQFLSSFFSIHLARIHVVHPYSRNDITTAWKKLHFIKAVHAFARHIDITFSRWDTAIKVHEPVPLF